jgi:chromosome segregation and condensation protein ScpB
MKLPIDHERDLSLEGKIEALLFIASEPVTVKQLSDALQISTSEIETGLLNLENR